jgi:hypothetical protein
MREGAGEGLAFQITMAYSWLSPYRTNFHSSFENSFSLPKAAVQIPSWILGSPLRILARTLEHYERGVSYFAAYFMMLLISGIWRRMVGWFGKYLEGSGCSLLDVFPGVCLEGLPISVRRASVRVNIRTANSSTLPLNQFVWWGLSRFPSMPTAKQAMTISLQPPAMATQNQEQLISHWYSNWLSSEVQTRYHFTICILIILSSINLSPCLYSAMIEKKPHFWDITPCSPLKINRSSRRACCLHLQGRRISQANLLRADFLLSLFFESEDGGEKFIRSVGCLSTDYMTLYTRRQTSSWTPLWE